MRKAVKRALLIIASIFIITLLVLGYTFLPAPIDLGKYDKTRDLELITRTKVNTAQLPAVSLSLIKTGRALSPEAFVYRGGNWLTTHESVHSAVLIRHPRGTFLFDSGLGTEVDQQFAGNSLVDRQLFKYQLIAPAITQLQANGIAPTDIKMIVLSHIHWDHASGVEDFPAAEVMTTKAEHDFGQTAPRPAVIREQFDDPGIKWRYIEFTNQAYENFERSLDLFGDGSIVLVPLLGHTPGSTGMFVNLPSGKRFFFIGDLAWAKEGFGQPTEKPWLVRQIVDNDSAQVRDTLVKIHWLQQQHPELIIVPAHDGRIHQQLAQFPQFEQ